MWDSVTHNRNVTLGESKQRIYTIDILVSDAVTHYGNVTRGEVHFFDFYKTTCPFDVGLCDTC